MTEKIVEELIDFIEKEERELQASNSSGENRTAKSDIVTRIIAKLDEEVNNADKNN